MRSLATMAVLGMCLLVVRCAQQSPEPASPPATALSPEQAANARRTIVAWLECEECTEGQLEAVTRLGPVAVPTLAVTLRQGPPPANRELHRAHLVDTYRQLKDYEKQHPQNKVTMSEDEYVRFYTANQTALYQIRAAQALATIGGADARRALQEALQLPLRDDVKATVRDSLQKLPAF